MTFQYVARNARGKIIKGKLSAANDSAAAELLNFTGYEVISLQLFAPFFSLESIKDNLFAINPTTIIFFYRQLAMLLESGTNIVTSLELMQEQATHRTMKKVIGKVVSDLRGGNPLSTSLLKYPKIFTPANCQLLAVGEQSGDIEVLLNQIADHMEKESATAKATKSALMMPTITIVVSGIVMVLAITFILPGFADMYESLGAELPAAVQLLIALGEALQSNFGYLLLGIAAIVSSVYFYIKTPTGSYRWDTMLLNLPRLGRIRLLGELARYCRSISLLFKAGMPLNEILPIIIKGSGNKVLANGLADVQRALLKGEGLSLPMKDNRYFLPLMVQMIKVGEETGNLDTTLMTIARSFEAEADDIIRSMVTLIPPALTLVIGGVVGTIAFTLISAMTSIYGEI